MDNQKAIQTVVNKAWDDPKFLADLVASPKAAIAASTGVKIPDDVDIVVFNQTDAKKVYINIPPKPDFDNMELSDEQLEQVAGGVSPVFVVTFALAASAGISAQGATIATGINNENFRQGRKHW
jgi:hypothetical protein